MGMLDAGTDYPNGPSQPSDGSSPSGLISPNAQHQIFLSAPFLLWVGWGSQLCLPNLLHMVLYKTLRLAHGPDLASLDLAPFFGVPGAVCRQGPVCSIVWQEARQRWGWGSTQGVRQVCGSEPPFLLCFSFDPTHYCSSLFSLTYRGCHKSSLLPFC